MRGKIFLLIFGMFVVVLLMGFVFMQNPFLSLTTKTIISNEEPSEIIEKVYRCDKNVYNCADFSTHEEAEKVFLGCGEEDIHYLDGDDDGNPCEVLNGYEDEYRF